MAKNVEFSYLYRDASNYKNEGSVVVSNPDAVDPKSAEKALRKCMDDGGWFIAAQIGVPDVFLWNAKASYDRDDPATYPKDLRAGKYAVSEDDHCWHEFSGLGVTDAPPSDPRTLAQLLRDFQSVGRKGWIPFDPAGHEGPTT